MDINELAMKKHEEWKGKIEVTCRAPLTTKEELSLAYTPGVAAPCLAIQQNPELSFTLTRRWNTVAVITDGTAVLGLGDIGPEAGMPVMEGKCALFKTFADIDAIPLCLRTKDTDEIVNTVRLLAGSFGGVNLEDIAAPRCFEIEKKLKEVCDIPIFHDDQHGTAVVVLAGIINALKVVGKKMDTCAVVISGAGAAGTAIMSLMKQAGFPNIIICDKDGALSADIVYENEAFTQNAKQTNPQMKKGTLGEILVGTDIFIGVSAPNVVTKEMISTMNKDAIVFAMANPIPEIMPKDAKTGGARVVATGRSDFPNQINNVLAFPGIFRGALDARASDITEEMKVAAAMALAEISASKGLSETNIIPSPFDNSVVHKVSRAVYEAAKKCGVSRI